MKSWTSLRGLFEILLASVANYMETPMIEFIYDFDIDIDI